MEPRDLDRGGAGCARDRLSPLPLRRTWHFAPQAAPRAETRGKACRERASCRRYASRDSPGSSPMGAIVGADPVRDGAGLQKPRLLRADADRARQCGRWAALRQRSVRHAGAPADLRGAADAARRVRDHPADHRDLLFGRGRLARPGTQDARDRRFDLAAQLGVSGAQDAGGRRSAVRDLGHFDGRRDHGSSSRAARPRSIWANISAGICCR